MNEERIEESPHNFWLSTCFVDTHRRSKNHARHDTPWNAFTQGRRALVNSLWVDRIVDVFDPEETRTRRFVKLGARSRKWNGQAVAHGKEARESIEAAIRDQIPVFGFEVEPHGRALERGERVIKHFYLDRVHQLLPVFGLRGDDLKERLEIEEAFRLQNDIDDEDIIQQGYVFELIAPIDEVPGSLEQENDSRTKPQQVPVITMRS